MGIQQSQPPFALRQIRDLTGLKADLFIAVAIPLNDFFNQRVDIRWLTWAVFGVLVESVFIIKPTSTGAAKNADFSKIEFWFAGNFSFFLRTDGATAFLDFSFAD